MIKVSIYAGETLTNQAPFETQEEAEAWVAYHGFANPVYEDITAKLEQERVNAEALAYLTSTDFYIIRELDSGVPCPAEVKAERAAARARIVK